MHCSTSYTRTKRLLDLARECFYSSGFYFLLSIGARIALSSLSSSTLMCAPNDRTRLFDAMAKCIFDIKTFKCRRKR